MPNPTTATAAQTSSETAQTILAAARRLFAEHGFDGVSISDVAAAAGVSKANVFHHFGAKRNLHLAVLKAAVNEFGQLTEHLQPERNSIDQRLQQFLHAHASHLAEYPQSAQVVLRELLENRADFTKELAEEAARAQFSRLFGLLQAAQQGGEIRADVDAAALAVMMIGVDVFLFQSRSLLRHLPEVHFADDPERFSRLLADILLHGITTKESEK